MADVTFGTTIVVSKGALSSTLYATNVTATMDQAGIKTTVYTLSSSAVSLSTANLSLVGVAQFWNISGDTNATVLVSAVSGANVVGFAAPRPGEPALMRLPVGVSFQATGHTAAMLRVDITEG
jgi:hypothetical protein